MNVHVYFIEICHPLHKAAWYAKKSGGCFSCVLVNRDGEHIYQLIDFDGDQSKLSNTRRFIHTADAQLIKTITIKNKTLYDHIRRRKVGDME